MTETLSNQLEILIANEDSTYEAWLATAPNGEDLGGGPEYDAWQEAEIEFVVYQCQTPAEAVRKAQVALTTRHMMDDIRVDEYEGGSALKYFLSSLIPSMPVDSGEVASCTNQQ